MEGPSRLVVELPQQGEVHLDIRVYVRLVGVGVMQWHVRCRKHKGRDAHEVQGEEGEHPVGAHGGEDVAVAAEREGEGSPGQRAPPLAEVERARRQAHQHRVEQRKAQQKGRGGVMRPAAVLSAQALCLRLLKEVRLDPRFQRRTKAVSVPIVGGHVVWHLSGVVTRQHRPGHLVVQVRAAKERRAIAAPRLFEKAPPTRMLI